MIQFTDQEQRILNVLGDGKPHSVDELMTCLWDELSGRTALRTCLTAIRKKLEPYSQYIHCIESRNGGPSRYVHVSTPAKIDYTTD